MRKYSDKKNAQTQNYYKDRFYHAPHTVNLMLMKVFLKEDLKF
ncbi:NADH dehydrogenase subunit C [Campylobacter jejuni]|nr:NADH dehydrogenase subunit C [Campylobacter jejuni]